MYILVLWAFNVVVVPPPYPPVDQPPITATVTMMQYNVPPLMVSAEFSSLTACEREGAAFVAAIKKSAEPAVVNAFFRCGKKAT